MSGETDLLGKKANELAQDLTLADDTFSGTLNWVTGYTGFSSVPAEQEGNYLPIHVTADASSTVTVELVGGTKGPVTLDEDRLHILRIANKSQTIKVVVKNGEASSEAVYKLSGLTLQAASQ